MTAPVFDLRCPLCFVLSASAAFQGGARCGAGNEKYADGCAVKLISIKTREQQQRRTRAADKSATDESAEAVSR
jgi:hypothetical protein